MKVKKGVALKYERLVRIRIVIEQLRMLDDLILPGSIRDFHLSFLMEGSGTLEKELLKDIPKAR
jgi:hypothetical protein